MSQLLCVVFLTFASWMCIISCSAKGRIHSNSVLLPAELDGVRVQLLQHLPCELAINRWVFRCKLFMVSLPCCRGHNIIEYI